MRLDLLARVLMLSRMQWLRSLLWFSHFDLSSWCSHVWLWCTLVILKVEISFMFTGAKYSHTAAACNKNSSLSCGSDSSKDNSLYDTRQTNCYHYHISLNNTESMGSVNLYLETTFQIQSVLWMWDHKKKSCGWRGWWCLRLSPFCVHFLFPANPLWPMLKSPKSLPLVKNITNMCMSRSVRQLEENVWRYAGGESM